jgi:hypothetical protein
MTLEAAKFLYGRGLINSIVTGLGGESMDVVTPDQLPGEAVEFLRLMANHYFKDDETRNKRMSEFKSERTKEAIKNGLVNYEMLNSFAGLGDMFKFQDSSAAKEGAEDLKKILGQFTIKSVEENGIRGYRIYDKYDFVNNEDYFRTIFPDIYESAREDGYDTSSFTGLINMVGQSIQKNLSKNPEGLKQMVTAVGHPISRAIAGAFIGEDMDEEDKVKIDFFIPADTKTETVADGSVNSVIYPEAFPEARPEDLERASAVIPNGPMDNERASVFQDFMNFIIPQAKAETVEQVVETKPLTFSQAFAQARSDGLEQFEFTNKSGETKMYTTELAK